jgi:hypothetical protein
LTLARVRFHEERTFVDDGIFVGGVGLLVVVAALGSRPFLGPPSLFGFGLLRGGE